MSNIALLDSVRQAIALQPSVSAGPSLVGANYIEFLSNALPPQIPNNESVTDEAMVGDGNSRTLRNTFNYYWQTRSFPVAGLLNDHIAAILMNGFLGGTRTTTTPIVPAKKYDTVQQSSSVTPSLFSIYRKLSGEEFITADLFANAFSISQDGSSQPTFNFDLMGTGTFLDSAALTLGAFTPASIILAPAYHYFHGAATEFTCTDGTDVYNFHTLGTLISVSIEGNNGGRVSRRPGDPFYNPADRNSGAMQRNITMGKATGHVIKVKIDLGSVLKEWKSMVARKVLTGGSIKFVGFDNVGVTATKYQFEIKFPKARFGVITGDTDDAYGALAIEIVPERDPVTNGLYVSSIQTGLTTELLAT